MNEISGTEILLTALNEIGVDTVLGYPGGAILPAYYALFHTLHIRHIWVRHEAGAIHAAEGYARSTGRPESSSWRWRCERDCDLRSAASGASTPAFRT